MLHINYNREGLSIPSFMEDIEKEVNIIIKELDTKEKVIKHYSTSEILYLILLKTKQGLIDYSRVVVHYNNYEIKVLESGQFDKYPDGFLDTQEKITLKILEERIK